MTTCAPATGEGPWRQRRWRKRGAVVFGGGGEWCVVSLRACIGRRNAARAGDVQSQQSFTSQRYLFACNDPVLPLEIGPKSQPNASHLPGSRHRNAGRGLLEPGLLRYLFQIDSAHQTSINISLHLHVASQPSRHPFLPIQPATRPVNAFSRTLDYGTEPNIPARCPISRTSGRGLNTNHHGTLI